MPEARNRKHYGLQLKATLLLTCSLVLTSNWGGIKYPFLILISLLLFGKKKKIEQRMLIILLPSSIYILCGIFSSWFNSFFSPNTFKQIVLLLVPAIVAIAIHATFSSADYDLIDITFWTTAIANIPDFFRVTSTDLAESEFAFIYGIFVIFYCIQKKWKYMLLAIVLFTFAHKRIAIGALAIGSLFFFILSRMRCKKSTLIRISAFLLILIPYAYIFLIHSTLMTSIFDSLGVNTMGRSESWKLFSKSYDFSLGFYGQGIGWIFERLSEMKMKQFGNLHNDFLLCFIECGFVGFGIWLFSYVYMLIKLEQRYNLSYKALLFLIVSVGYTFINYTTDNILVYISYWLPLDLIILEICNKRLLE